MAKIYVVEEVSDDPVYCLNCLHLEPAHCSLFGEWLDRDEYSPGKKDFKGRKRCEDCLNAPTKVCECHTSKNVHNGPLMHFSV